MSSGFSGLDEFVIDAIGIFTSPDESDELSSSFWLLSPLVLTTAASFAWPFTTPFFFGLLVPRRGDLGSLLTDLPFATVAFVDVSASDIVFKLTKCADFPPAREKRISA
jgi:hypothetical protein